MAKESSSGGRTGARDPKAVRKARGDEGSKEATLETGERSKETGFENQPTLMRRIDIDTVFGADAEISRRESANGRGRG